MVERNLSMRGEIVDFNKLRLRNAEKIALGNANMNAKGDIVGKNGIVIKTQEQIDADWQYRMDEQRQATVDIKNSEAVKTAAGSESKKTVEKNLDSSDMNFEPQVQNSRRKMIESDE
jgi:hypothetical protein